MKWCVEYSSWPRLIVAFCVGNTPPKCGFDGDDRIFAKMNWAAARGEMHSRRAPATAAFAFWKVVSPLKFCRSTSKYTHFEMSSEICTQTCRLDLATSKALFRAGVSLPPITALRPNA